MNKIALLVFFLILLTSCSPSVTSSSLLTNTATATAAFTPKPELTQTPTPTSIPFLRASKFKFLTLNAITPIDSTSHVDQMDYWVVGNEGFITHWSYGGPTYVGSPAGRQNLYDVDFVSPEDGWIVGEDGLILHWNGESWEVSKPAILNPGPHSSYDLYNVVFNEVNDGWAAGCTHTEGGEYFLVYHWDGISWSEESLSTERDLWACVHDMAALATNDIWMTGTGWEMGKEYGVTIHWNGVHWERRAELNSYNIHSISALSPNNIWAVTGNGTVLNWDGTEWSEKVQLDFTGLENAPVVFAREPHDIFVAGNKIFHWDGSNWTDMSSNSNLPADMKIVDIVTGGVSEGGNPFIYMLDASGIMYSFAKENFR